MKPRKSAHKVHKTPKVSNKVVKSRKRVPRITLSWWRHEHRDCKVRRSEYSALLHGKVVKIFLAFVCDEHRQMLLYDEVTPGAYVEGCPSDDDEEDTGYADSVDTVGSE